MDLAKTLFESFFMTRVLNPFCVLVVRIFLGVLWMIFVLALVFATLIGFDAVMNIVL